MLAITSMKPGGPEVLELTEVPDPVPGPDEVVIFAWITYKSKEHRDEVNAKVMADPRMAPMMNAENPPFDCTRMAYGGFKLLVKA